MAQINPIANSKQFNVPVAPAKCKYSLRLSVHEQMSRIIRYIMYRQEIAATGNLPGSKAT